MPVCCFKTKCILKNSCVVCLLLVVDQTKKDHKRMYDRLLMGPSGCHSRNVFLNHAVKLLSFINLVNLSLKINRVEIHLVAPTLN